MASRLLARCVVFAAGFGLIAIAAQSVRAADATSRPAYPSANAPAANAQPAAVAPAAPSPKELRAAVADAMRRANSAKGAEIPAAAKSLVNLYHELGADVLLPARQRVRLGLQVRVRLQRFASQIRYEMAHNSSRPASIAATQTAAGSAGPAAAEGLNDMVELIQTTIGQPDDWVAVQQNALRQAAGGQAFAGGVGVGAGGAGAAHGGGAFGNAAEFDKAAAQNGADLVDLIQKTVNPPSWDINGGPGTIMYFNNLRVLVVRQTAEDQDNVGGLLGGLRK